MHANLPGTPTEYLDVVGRPRGDVPANPEAIVQARRLLTDSLPKIEMNDADAAEGGCGVVGLASEIPIAGRHLFKSLEQMRNGRVFEKVGSWKHRCPAEALFQRSLNMRALKAPEHARKARTWPSFFN